MSADPSKESGAVGLTCIANQHNLFSPTIPGYVYLGLIKDLGDLDIERVVQAEDCWSRMERLIFQSSDVVLTSTVKMMQTVRSDVVMLFPKIEYSR
ncbi:hypothetical protein BGZ59_006870 [Podila verticillata]|nr:hypothetical protein BGZ59_006870 [Podila verticillata]